MHQAWERFSAALDWTGRIETPQRGSPEWFDQHDRILEVQSTLVKALADPPLRYWPAELAGERWLLCELEDGGLLLCGLNETELNLRFLGELPGATSFETWRDEQLQGVELRHDKLDRPLQFDLSTSLHSAREIGRFARELVARR